MRRHYSTSWLDFEIRGRMLSMIKTLEWTAGGVVMIEQRLLPDQEIYNCYTSTEVAEAIKTMA